MKGVNAGAVGAGFMGLQSPRNSACIARYIIISGSGTAKMR